MAKADDILSLSDPQIHDDTGTLSKQPNQSFIQDFFGFSTEEWNHTTSYDTSPDYVNFRMNLDSSKPPISVDDVNKPKKMEETNPIFRSKSGSFRYMRYKTISRPSTSRSMSVTVMERSRMASKSKSRWQVFMFGLGSGKFPTKMDLSDIKSRQLHRRSTRKADLSDVNSRQPRDDDQRSGKKTWWRFVNILGCGGGFVRDAAVVAF